MTSPSIAELVAKFNHAAQLRDFFLAARLVEDLLLTFPSHAQIRRNAATANNNAGALARKQYDLVAAEKYFRRSIEIESSSIDAWINLLDLFGDMGRLDEIENLADNAPPACKLELEFDLALSTWRAQLDSSPRHLIALQRALELSRGTFVTSARLLQATIILNDEQLLKDDFESSKTELDLATLQSGLDLLCARGALDSFRSATKIVFAGETSADQVTRTLAQLQLPIVYRSLDEISQTRNEFESALHELEKFTPKQSPDAINKIESLLYSPRNLTYQGFDDLALLSRLSDWQSTWLRARAPKHLSTVKTRPKRGRAKVGLVSSAFRRGATMNYFHAWVDLIKQAGFEVGVIQLSHQFDQLTASIKSDSDFFLQGNFPLLETAEKIAQLECDFLIYLDLDITSKTRLLAQFSLAPIQLAAWGHPSSSGIQNLDGYISCAVMERDRADDDYRETLLRLPGIGTRYGFISNIENANRAELGLPEGVLYYFPHVAAKFHPDTDAIFAEILSQDRAAKILMAAPILSVERDLVSTRTKEICRSLGLGQEKIVLLPSLTRARFLQVMSQCDVLLDAPHYSAGAIALDALSIGLPIAALSGTLMRSRQTLGILSLLDQQQDCVANLSLHANNAMRIAHSKSVRASYTTRSDELPAKLNSLIDSSHFRELLIGVMNKKTFA